MDGNNDTVGHCVRGTRYGQVLELGTGVILAKQRRSWAKLTCLTRTSGGSRSMSRAVDSAWRCPRTRRFSAWVIDA